MSSPCSWPPKTLPSTRGTRQAPQTAGGKSDGRPLNTRRDNRAADQCRSSRPSRARGRRNSPNAAHRSGLPCRSSALFYLKTDWPDMPGMPDLTVIKGREPDADSSLKRNIVFAVGVEAAAQLHGPVPGGPAGRTSDVGAITREFAGDDDSWNNRPHRDRDILLRRIRH